MGCIYHLGIDSGTLIEGNVCTNTSAYYYGGWGYYLASNNGLFEPFAYKTSILPRQARDKHRENSKKRPFVLRTRALVTLQCEATSHLTSKLQASRNTTA
jgi:hypothetical protein